MDRSEPLQSTSYTLQNNEDDLFYQNNLKYMLKTLYKCIDNIKVDMHWARTACMKGKEKKMKKLKRTPKYERN